MNARGLFPVRSAQLGFAIVSAIFLLVALAALGAFMVSFSNTQQLTSAQDVQGSRAYWAARGGVQWVTSEIVRTDDCPSAAGQVDFADGFVVDYTCDDNTYDEGVTTRTIFWVTATATAGGVVGDRLYVERQIQVFVE